MAKERPLPKPELQQACLRLTSDFEGGGRLAGNFDGQGISWGPLQWNLGQGTLYPLLKRIYALNPDSMTEIMGKEFVEALESETALRALAQKRIRTDHPEWPTWAQRFSKLSKTQEAQTAFVEHARPYFLRASALAQAVGFVTERGFALCFDIAVQNGAPRRDHIREYRARLTKNPSLTEEWQRLLLMARVVSDLANPRWREDVYARKRTIALGRGWVHGKYYVLEDYGISYKRGWCGRGYNAPT